MTIKVRQCDINQAIKDGDGSCPITHSIWRKHRRRVPCMASDWIWIDGLGDCALPTVAVRFVADFYAERLVQPITFEIPLNLPHARRRRSA